MRRFLLLTSVIFLCSILTSFAQDYSNRGLAEIKEHVDSRRMNWNKVFDDAVLSKDFKTLPAARHESEAYVDAQLSALRRLFAQGDGRALLTSVTNYLQIQKQFVKDVMVEAESIKGDNPEEVEKINQKISAFAQKEKIFLIEINNALATEPNDYQPPTDLPEEDEELEEPQEVRGSVVEGREGSRRSGKLPHEKGRKKNKDKDKDKDEESEE